MSPCERCGGEVGIVELKRMDGTKCKVSVCHKCGLKELRREDANTK
jgi:hypothetical protein